MAETPIEIMHRAAEGMRGDAKSSQSGSRQNRFYNALAEWVEAWQDVEYAESPLQRDDWEYCIDICAAYLNVEAPDV